MIFLWITDYLDNSMLSSISLISASVRSVASIITSMSIPFSNNLSAVFFLSSLLHSFIPSSNNILPIFVIPIRLLIASAFFVLMNLSLMTKSPARTSFCSCLNGRLLSVAFIIRDFLCGYKKIFIFFSVKKRTPSAYVPVFLPLILIIPSI